jgi:ABC-type transporter Mla subunit MlaD
MSIPSDLRAYADSAVNQGKQTLSTASAQLSGVSEQASELVNDLRASAEKLINVDAVRTAVEPYLDQLRTYGDSVGERVEEIVSSLKKDPRFGKLVETADSVSAVVVELVQERVVKPVQSLTRGNPKAAPKPPSKPASKATKPAATRPATRKPAAKTTARKAPTKRAGSTA